MAQVSLNKTFNDVKNTKSAANSAGGSIDLKDTDSGKAILVDASTAAENFTINLPAAAAGLYFLFVLVADSAGDSQVLIDPNGTEKIDGYAVAGAGMGHVQAFHDAAAALGWTDSEKMGSRLELVSDGTGWFIVSAGSSLGMITAFS